MRELDTRLLERIAKYITDFQVVQGRSPSQRDIAAKCYINSKRTHKYVHALARKGVIELNYDGTIAVPNVLATDDVQEVPLIGMIHCGQPTLAVEDFEEMFRLPRQFTGSGEFFMLNSIGDSMIDAGINESDYLVIRRQETADSGDIVVAIKTSDYSDDAEATLKRFIIVDGEPVLHPENEGGGYEDLDAREYRIVGKLVGILRKID